MKSNSLFNVSILVLTIGIVTPVMAQVKAPAQSSQTDCVVAADGTGQYKTVQDAINAAAMGTPEHPTMIHVKPGTYHEIVYVQREKRFVKIIGDDAAKTTITYELSANVPGLDGKPIGTFRTPTATIDADDFTVENITFENAAGPKGQAVAIRIDGDRVAFRNCRFLGWQDTILDNRGRHYYSQCDVTGAVDFIFGGATAVYDHCKITQLRPEGGDLTAPSTPLTQEYGLVFLACRLLKGTDVKANSTGLMRPWRGNGESAFINCVMDDQIMPKGWDAWGGREKTCRAYEFGSVDLTGKPIDVSQRAPWSHQLTAAEAAKYTPETIFSDWHPPFTPSTH